MVKNNNNDNNNKAGQQIPSWIFNDREYSTDEINEDFFQKR